MAAALVSLQPTDDTVIVHVGSQKRHINLPLTLSNRELSGAELKDNELILKFKRE